MQRLPWHDSLLESLDELADPQAQSRAWVDGDLDFVSSPAELLCQVFDDSALYQLLPAGVVFSAAADDLLRELGVLADAVETSQGPAALLADPAWLRLTEGAARARAAVAEALAPPS